MPHAGTACTICRHARREALEAAASVDGTELLAVAQIFGVSRRTLEKHMAGHGTNGNLLVAPARSTRGAAEAAEPRPESPALGDGTVVERARALLAYLAVPGRTPQELAQAREIRAALTLEARLVGAMTTKAKLHEHPYWPVLVEELVTALARIPGALDALEAFLVRAEERRAA